MNFGDNKAKSAGPLRIEADFFVFLGYGVFGEIVVVAVGEIGAIVGASALVAG
jgi:hypothetical protein